MKKHVLHAAILAVIFCLPNVAAAQLSVMKDPDGKVKQIKVAFTRQLTAEDLRSIRNELQQQHNIILTINSETFDAQGKLQSIKFAVDCKDGFNGSASTEKVKSAPKFGFVRDYRSNAASAFSIGAIGGKQKNGKKAKSKS